MSSSYFYYLVAINGNKAKNRKFQPSKLFKIFEPISHVIFRFEAVNLEDSSKEMNRFRKTKRKMQLEQKFYFLSSPKTQTKFSPFVRQKTIPKRLSSKATAAHFPLQYLKVPADVNHGASKCYGKSLNSVKLEFVPFALIFQKKVALDFPFFVTFKHQNLNHIATKLVL